MKKKILIIDDSPEIATLTKSRLEAHDYEVATAADGDEGLRKIGEAPPDLIVLDIKMPKMDGWSFVRELKKRGLKQIPIIMLTAYHKMQDLFAIEGINDYIVKPFKAEELLERIDSHLKAAPQQPAG